MYFWVDGVTSNAVKRICVILTQKSYCVSAEFDCLETHVVAHAVFFCHILKKLFLTRMCTLWELLVAFHHEEHVYIMSECLCE